MIFNLPHNLLYALKMTKKKYLFSIFQVFRSQYLCVEKRPKFKGILVNLMFTDDVPVCREMHAAKSLI